MFLAAFHQSLQFLSMLQNKNIAKDKFRFKTERKVPDDKRVVNRAMAPQPLDSPLISTTTLEKLQGPVI